MGGRGGQKQRKRTGPGGKFDSTGTHEQARENAALVVRILPYLELNRESIGVADQCLIDDCRMKLQQQGTNAMFGWRQVERLVELKRILAAGGKP